MEEVREEDRDLRRCSDEEEETKRGWGRWAR